MRKPEQGEQRVSGEDWTGRNKPGLTWPPGSGQILWAPGKPVEILKKLSDVDRDLRSTGWATEQEGAEVRMEMSM